MFEINDKTILITGASSGIGKEIAVCAANLGANVIITGRNIERLQNTHQQIGNKGHLIAADLTDQVSLAALIAELPELDGIVFCAGIVEYVPVKFISAEKLASVFSINFNSQVALTQAVLKKKKIKKGGSLVYISSISSKLGVMGTSLYASSKAALNAFAKVTASELASQAIRVNCICPGIVETPMIDNASAVLSEGSFEKAESDYPLGIGKTTDVAGSAIFLLSNASRWITGTELILDGGLTIK